MSQSIQIISVGSEDPLHTAYALFLTQHSCNVAIARTCAEFYTGDLRLGECDVAVFHPMLQLDELREIAQFIRHRWPRARIVIIRCETWQLQDSCYDDRVNPGANPEILLSTIQRLIAGYREPLRSTKGLNLAAHKPQSAPKDD
jgi:hypothetical protein